MIKFITSYNTLLQKKIEATSNKNKDVYFYNKKSET